MPLSWALVAMGCGKLVGLDADYHLDVSSGGGSNGNGGASGAGGDGDDTGGVSHGGSGANGKGGDTGGTSAPGGGTSGEAGGGGDSATGGTGNTSGTGDTGGTGATGGTGDTGGTRVTGGRGGTGGMTGGSAGMTGGSAGMTGGSAGMTGGSAGMTGGSAGMTGGTAGTTGGTGGGLPIVPPPSCTPGVNDCGEAENIDCCRQHLVPGGNFNRGNDTLYPATVADFVLDDFEVTVARFRKFEAAFAAGYRPPIGSGKNPSNAADTGWQSAWTSALPANRAALRSALACDSAYPVWTDSPGANEFRPVNCIDWYVAAAFCIWDGGRLPSEAEWNYAAAGGMQQRVYPWSDPPSSTIIAERHASYRVDDMRECGGDMMNGCAVTDFIRPGSRPDGEGAFHQFDLAGNVYEWVQDRYGAYVTDCDNCSPMTGTQGVIRGGCFSTYYNLEKTAFRLNWPLNSSDAGIGIRCARGP